MGVIILVKPELAPEFATGVQIEEAARTGSDSEGTKTAIWRLAGKT